MFAPTRILCRSTLKSPVGEISLAGCIHGGQGCGHPNMRVLGAYALVYLAGGTGRFADALGHDQAVGAGDLLLVFPEVAHRYGPEAGGAWHEIYAVFEGPIFRLWEERGLLSPRRPLLHLEPVEYWYHRIESIFATPVMPDFGSPLVQVCRLQQLLADALDAQTALNLGRQDLQWVHRVAAMLESDLGRDIDLGALAGQLSVTPDSFRKRFTRLVGTTPARYRAKKLMDRACELIQQGLLTDKQIAYRLGFCDEFHFSRRFKKLVGMPPRTFRRNLPQAGSVAGPRPV